MFIPPPDFTAPDSVRVYRKDPTLNDERQDRIGLVAGHRVDRVVYTFDRPGRFVLPAFDVAWFDIAAGKQQLARAEAVSVTVADVAVTSTAIAPEPPPTPELAPPPDRRRLIALIALLAVIVLWSMRHAARRGLGALSGVVALGWRELRRDRARHLPPLNW